MSMENVFSLDTNGGDNGPDLMRVCAAAVYTAEKIEEQEAHVKNGTDPEGYHTYDIGWEIALRRHYIEDVCQNDRNMSREGSLFAMIYDEYMRLSDPDNYSHGTEPV